MPKIVDLTVATTVAGTEYALIVQGGISKLLLFTDLKEYVFPSASVGGQSAGSIVTVDDTQTMYFKTLSDVSIIGQSNSIANAQIATSVWVGGTINAPAITSPNITGTGTSIIGGTKSDGTIERDVIYDSFLQGCVVTESGVSKGAVVSLNGVQAITNKAISASTITTSAIDSATTIDGKRIADHMATKPDLVGVGSVSTTILKTTGAGVTSVTVSAEDIFDALALAGIDEGNYSISALDIVAMIYLVGVSTYTPLAINVSGSAADATMEIFITGGVGKAATLDYIDFKQLTAQKSYYISIHCRIID